jgi:hypothetical protein
VIWVSWRLQRTETLVVFGILVLLAALLVPTGLHMASAYDNDGLAACIGKSTASCNDAIDAFTQRFAHLGDLLGWLNLVPGVFGVLLAAPLLLDIENGTYRLAWTQSITRRRWLAGKLGLTIAVALLSALAMLVLLTWWRTPLDHVHGRMNDHVFDFEGIVPFAYVLFALGLTLAIGALWRRTVPALIIGVVGYVASRVFVAGWVRPHYQAPLTATWPAKENGPDLSHAWLISERPSDKLGHPLQTTLALRDCITPLRKRLGSIDYACLAHKGAGFTHAVYHPASRFWAFQGIETALFGGVAVALILFAAWWIHDRVA